MNRDEPPQYDEKSEGKPISEQPRTGDAGLMKMSVMRPLDIYHTWQPMGYRVTINLPFVGNDKDFLFGIRVTPRIWHPYFLNKCRYDYKRYFYNNVNVVSHVIQKGSDRTITNSPVSITQYDIPGNFGILSHAYRFYSGSIKYHLRAISGFTTQGYIGATIAKGIKPSASTFDEYNIAPAILDAESSYRTYQQNSYERSDASQFRHFEVQVPQENLFPTVDMYHRDAMARTVQSSENKPTSKTFSVIDRDQWIVLYPRGNITTAGTTGQLSYELEICPGDDFQFSGENYFPSSVFLQSNYKPLDPLEDGPIIRPNAKLISDGISTVKATPTTTTKPPTSTTTAPVDTGVQNFGVETVCTPSGYKCAAL